MAKARGYSWSALDESCEHPITNRVADVFDDNDGVVNQEADQVNKTKQQSVESIIVKDSCDIEITTTDTQVAVSLQAALQVAIALVINITIADSNRAEQVTQELLQQSQIKQTNYQELVIENSRKVTITTTDTDVAVSIQLLLQILVALVVSLDLF